MKFEIRRVVKALELKEYAAEYEGTTITVWVNPPLKLLQGHDRILDEINQTMKAALVEGRLWSEIEAETKPVIEGAAAELVGVFSELWSQGAEGTRWTPDEVKQLATDTQDSDPQLWAWLRNRTIELIREHRSTLKKS